MSTTIYRKPVGDVTRDEAVQMNDVYNEVWAEFYPEDPPTPVEELMSDFIRPTYSLWDFWFAVEGADMVAVGRLERSNKDNVHIARTSVSVRPAHRRRGIGTEIAQEILKVARDEAREVARANTVAGSPYAEFARSIGFERVKQKGADTFFDLFENRLDLRSLDRTLLEGWVGKAKERAADYELVFWEGPTPGDLLVEFARLHHVMNTSPVPEGWNAIEYSPEKVAEWESSIAAGGWPFWTYASKHLPTGEFAGFTRVYPNPFRPEIVYQDDTGVEPAHRNRGLGRWLKAAMLQRILEQIPRARFVTTGNATSNEPMLGINNALGFRPYLVWEGWHQPLS